MIEPRYELRIKWWADHSDDELQFSGSATTLPHIVVHRIGTKPVREHRLVIKKRPHWSSRPLQSPWTVDYFRNEAMSCFGQSVPKLYCSPLVRCLYRDERELLSHSTLSLLHHNSRQVKRLLYHAVLQNSGGITLPVIKGKARESQSKTKMQSIGTLVRFSWQWWQQCTAARARTCIAIVVLSQRWMTHQFREVLC